MPRVDFLTWCIDVLASRYGWTRNYCLEDLYWEEFWELVVLAANYEAEEQNAEYRFNYMLHTDKKGASKWQDLPLPFPDNTEKPSVPQDKGGVSQLPYFLQGVVYRPDAVAERK